MADLYQDLLPQAMGEMGEMAPDQLGGFVEEKQEDTEEGHLVQYLNACQKESFERTKERREKNVELWHAHESVMPDYHDKDDWQSAIVLNQPFSTTQHAAAVVRRGLFGRSDHMFLEPWQDQEDQVVKLKVNFWKRALKFWGNRPTSDRRLKFVDSCRYGFAMGLSGALKYTTGTDNLQRETVDVQQVEPWKLYYDQDNRMPRNPQSGLYSIHEEVVDLYQILELGRQGVYINTELLSGSSRPSDEMGEFAEHARQYETRDQDSSSAVYTNPFRKKVTIREFYGTVLDPNGDILLPNAHYITANNVLIKPLDVTPFPTIRWPWSDFAPLPHPSKYHGYGLYEGTMGIWKFMCNLLNLYIDNENFRINNMYEVVEEALHDATDGEFHPGRRFRKKPGHDGPAIVPVLKNQSNVQDVQFMWSVVQALWQEGTNVNQFVTGQQAGGEKMTATELNIKTQQSMGVLDSMIGKDVEDGYCEVIKLEQEFLQTYWNPAFTRYYDNAFIDDPFYQFLAGEPMDEEMKMEAMALEADVRVHGISRAFEKAQVAQEILSFMQISAQPAYLPYAKPYETYTKYAEMIDLPELVKSEEELRQEMIQSQIQGIVPGALAAAGLGPEPGMEGEGDQGSPPPQGPPQGGSAAQGPRTNAPSPANVPPTM